MEVKIVSAVKAAVQQGIGVTRQQLLTRVGALCKQMNVSPFKHAVPTKAYWLGLKKRHTLTIRRSEKLQTSRASMLNEVVLGKYFHDLKMLLDSNNITEKPAVMWNCDETGKQFEHNPVCLVSDQKKEHEM